jgi:hypothetical protein
MYDMTAFWVKDRPCIEQEHLFILAKSRAVFKMATFSLSSTMALQLIPTSVPISEL